MNKVFMSVAVIAMMAAAVACECNNSKKAEEEPAQEAVEACEEAAEACEEAAAEVAEAVEEAVAE